MKRNDYQKPAMRMVELRHKCRPICVSNPDKVQTFNNNADLHYGGSDENYVIDYQPGKVR